MENSNSLRSTMASILSQNQASDNDNQFKKAMEPLQELIKVTEKNISDLSEIKEHSTMLLKHLSKRVQGKSNKEVFLDFVSRNSPISVKNLNGIQNSDYSVEALRNTKSPIIMPQLPHFTQERILNSLDVINNSSNRRENSFYIDDINNNDQQNDFSKISYNECLIKTPENEKNLRRLLNVQNFHDTPKGRVSYNHLNIHSGIKMKYDESPDLRSSSHISNVTTSDNGSKIGYVTFTSPKSLPYYNQSPVQSIFNKNYDKDKKMFVVSIKAILKETPGISIIGRLIGPKGMNIKSLEEECRCQIFIRGKGSSKDPEKEKKLSRHPCGAHFSEPLHVIIQTSDVDYKIASDRLFEAVNKINTALDFTNNVKHLTVLENISCKQIDYLPINAGY
ncbi:Protein quaking [Strongyloides ratti]|uniref:Protein quaking n=1 Tax=Strongyloides ratti TaxID=34506 RepID=A0A090LBG5_STRRB|nr:Protein quaking [Strongyloides ratti]CEF65473.1 Protein quaking [Strongyloides ratti]